MQVLRSKFILDLTKDYICVCVYIYIYIYITSDGARNLG